MTLKTTQNIGLTWIALLCVLLVENPLAAFQIDIPPVPETPREYRGVWVATVANIDWPSKPGLDSSAQQAEAVQLLDKMVELKMNVVVLQVRTSCDALYASQLEPWSYFLTGKQGAPPQPLYDPLEFWINESHRRGLELHAWFNPFRAKNSGQTYADCDQHISRSQPSLVKRYGNEQTNYLWLDPGEVESRVHSLRVFLDVLNRYDVDGIHIDDYFYPYPVDEIPFPDDPAWSKYVAAGGSLNRDDWRRDSMNQFIKQLYTEIKARKPHVKFGISPFGIWKPGYPASVAGFSQHDKLYADARLWLNEGWCDYYTPQLYWAISAKQQSFPALLNWWANENKHARHLVPGLYTGRIGNKTKAYSVEEVVNQVYLSRHTPGSSGAIHFSMRVLAENREGIVDRLKKDVYDEPALTPALTWLSNTAPEAPTVTFDKSESGSRATWKAAGNGSVGRWCVYTLRKNKWNLEIVGPFATSMNFEADSAPVEAVGISQVDLHGNESPRTVMR